MAKYHVEHDQGIIVSSPMADLEAAKDLADSMLHSDPRANHRYSNGNPAVEYNVSDQDCQLHYMTLVNSDGVVKLPPRS